MNNLTIKDAMTSISRVRQMEEEGGFREYDTPSLAFHLVKIYRLAKELKEKIDMIKIVLIDKKVERSMFWEDEMRVWIGNKNSTSSIDMEQLYKEVLEQKLVHQFLKVCTIAESNIEEPRLKALFLKHKKVIPGAKDCELKIDKITNADKMANV